jgi:hypothetical protein
MALFNLVAREPKLCLKLVDNLLDSKGEVAQILTESIILAGQIPEHDSGLLANLVSILIGTRKARQQQQITKLIIEIIKSKKKWDSAEILDIILNKAQMLNGSQKGMLKNLLNCISQLNVMDVPKWYSAIEFVLDKLQGFPITHQRVYIESHLKSYGLTKSLTNFTGVLTDFEETQTTTITQLRHLYFEFIEDLVEHIGYTPSNIQNNLKFLESHDILKETPSNRGDPHLERTFSYALYGLLEHYDMFKTLLTEEITFALLIETIHWIYFLIKRYELKLIAFAS